MFSEAKAIGKAIKAKGLGKLKWYCEVCKKQCRDENGFQNHLTTEGHLRNVSLFAEDSKKYIHQYSSDFQQGFLDIVRTRFKTVTVRATLVYNEYIKDRHHTHMNATRWETLTAFCHHLARAGIVEIGNDASGFLTIRYVEKDPEMIERERRMRAREEMEATDSERSARVLAMQVEAARQEKMALGEESYFDPSRPEGLSSGSVAVEVKKRKFGGVSLLGDDGDDGDGDGDGGGVAEQPPAKMSSAAALMKEQERIRAEKAEREKAERDKAEREREKAEREKAEREKAEREKKKETQEPPPQPAPPQPAPPQPTAPARKDKPWPAVGITVKIVHKSLEGGRYHGLKGVVSAVLGDGHLAEVEVRNSDGSPGDVLRLDQKNLETVIPKPGGTVTILAGPKRGEKGTIKEIHTKDFCASLQEYPDERFDYGIISKS